MTHSEKPAVVLAGMIIAAIYVIMLISLTRSSYFIGGAALDRTARRADVIAVNRVTPVADIGAARCTAPEPMTEDALQCLRATRTLRRLLGLRLE